MHRPRIALEGPNTSGDRSPIVGLIVGLCGVGLIVALFEPFDVPTTTPAIALIVPVVVAALLSGRIVAVWVGVVAALAYDLAFLAPIGSLRIAVLKDVVAAVLFFAVALATGSAVGEQTRRRRAAVARADELATMHAELSAAVAERDRLEQRTRDLAVLEEVDRQRRALLRAVSHDLRTPLGTIRVVMSDLRDGTVYEPATRAELLDLAVRETERLDRIVTNLLSMSRIEAGSFSPDLQPCDLRDVVRQVTSRIDGLFTHARLEVRLPTDLPPVLADATQLDLVFTNLLENAARHAPSGSTVRVEGACNSDVFVIEVIDEGTGVDPSNGEAIFQPFSSLDGRTGLGLPICRAILEAHGGTVTVGDSQRGGARFLVSIPIGRQRSDPDRRGRSVDGAGRERGARGSRL
ncbi:MAG: PAS domain-containing sensor histidine kinase [Actinobacteria bacterium]|nr:MAG: PAS domain-containing sensor histidine kinase [Actinomycetota bacterium]